jgi:hypothetical protein
VVANSPQEEAIGYFSEIIRELSAPNPNMISILRRGRHACQLLNWTSQRDFVDHELTGYYQGAAVPDHRIIKGEARWVVELPSYTTQQISLMDTLITSEPEFADREPVEMPVGTAIANIYAYTTSGYIAVQEMKKASSKKKVGLQRVHIYPAYEFSRIISTLEHKIFVFCSDSYAYLKYGSAISDSWIDYQVEVDKALHDIGIGDHIKVIQNGLQSANPEAWRAATLECRSVLNDVADYLWKDQRPRYEYLPNHDGTAKMDVSAGRYSNRLAAYIHQKGLSGTRGKFLREEVERLAASISALISLASEAHQPIGRMDARTTAISTYFVLGELALRTDMVPIEQYGVPAAPHAIA